MTTINEQLARSRRAEDQRTHYQSLASQRPNKKQRPAKLGTLHRRNGDRASPDDDDPAPRLTTFVRFRDLVAANIVQNWPTLRRLIREQQFPPGIMIGPNMRAWPAVEVEAWLASRPTANSNIRLLGSSKAPQKKVEAST
jgi:predicted DNA-binding transcriptional regulator AlpA